jgi:hypothetical protein
MDLPKNLNDVVRDVDPDICSCSRNTIQNGVLYFCDDKKLVTGTLDGQKITVYHSTEPLNSPRILHVGNKGTLSNEVAPSE